MKQQFAVFLSSKGESSMLEKKIVPGMDVAIKVCLSSSIPSLSPAEGCFQLLGFDFMLNQDGSVQLLEVNRNPDLEPHTRGLHALITRLVDDTLGVATEVHIRKRDNRPLWPVSCSHFYEPLMLPPDLASPSPGNTAASPGEVALPSPGGGSLEIRKEASLSPGNTAASPGEVPPPSPGEGSLAANQEMRKDASPSPGPSYLVGHQ
jgi:hypothetical protein